MMPNKSLQRSGGRCPLVCSSLVVLDKVPALGRCEPPADELSRYATGSVVVHESS
jgi:hypothetical protein